MPKLTSYLHVLIIIEADPNTNPRCFGPQTHEYWATYFHSWYISCFFGAVFYCTQRVLYYLQIVLHTVPNAFRSLPVDFCSPLNRS